MEYFKTEIIATKGVAQQILDLMEESDVKELVLEDIPIEAISDFVQGKRKNIWEITINDTLMMEVVANQKSGKAMVEMLKEKDGKSFPLPPISIQNFKNFVQGKRKNILSVEMAHVAPNEELPGHI